MDNGSNHITQCFWSDLKNNPKCPHGPTLLFGQFINDEWRKFYVCSACRERSLCSFSLNQGTTLSKVKAKFWEQENKNFMRLYNPRKLYIKFHEIMGKDVSQRAYCHNCEKLISISEKEKHENHELVEGLTDHQMLHPTQILKPLTNVKKEAQYLFSEKSTKEMVDFLLALGAERVLCIGSPRIYEYICNEMEDKLSALLLDFDGRFHNFFSPMSYKWFNLFNCHFFFEGGKETLKEFMTQDNGRNVYVICDPPFGGRVEAMSQTIQTISDYYKKWNKLEDDAQLKILFIFPYFMEPIMKHKANPPGQDGGLKDLKMLDYQVEYDNHPLFIRKDDNTLASPVRIFTNVPLNLFKLSEADGYKYCKRCDRWVMPANKHCKKCKNCTSKDGKRYRHCNACQRCVKGTWEHCKKCQRCCVESHKCGLKPRVGFCYSCNTLGHTENNCEAKSEPSDVSKTPKKRKISTSDDEDSVTKKKSKPEKLTSSLKNVKKAPRVRQQIASKKKVKRKNPRTKS